MYICDIMKYYHYHYCPRCAWSGTQCRRTRCSSPGTTRMCVSVYIYIYIYTHTYTYIHIYTEVALTPLTALNGPVAFRPQSHVMRTRKGSTYLYIHLYIYIYIMLYACMYVYIYIYDIII